jgi:cell division protein FtsB
MRQLAEMQAIAAEKDSLLKDVTATSAFLADLTKQVGTVRNLKSGGAANAGDLEDNLTRQQRREQLVAQVQEITQRVNMAENRLAVSRRRVTELTGLNAEKSKRLAEFDSTITSFKAMLENQRTQVTALSEQVEALTAENTQLRADNVQLVSRTTTLTSERDALTTERNTVYYVVAPQDELVARHVVEKSGGFLGLGKTPVVARNLESSAFTPIDKTQVLEIPLPDPAREYRVISRQDLGALETPPEKGIVKGTLRIRDPQAFWAASRYLVVIEM